MFAGSLMPDFSMAFWLFFAALVDFFVAAGGSLEILIRGVDLGGPSAYSPFAFDFGTPDGPVGTSFDVELRGVPL